MLGYYLLSVNLYNRPVSSCTSERFRLSPTMFRSRHQRGEATSAKTKGEHEEHGGADDLSPPGYRSSASSLRGTLAQFHKKRLPATTPVHDWDTPKNGMQLSALRAAVDATIIC